MVNSIHFTLVNKHFSLLAYTQFIPCKRQRQGTPTMDFQVTGFNHVNASIL